MERDDGSLILAQRDENATEQVPHAAQQIAGVDIDKNPFHIVRHYRRGAIVGTDQRVDWKRLN
jgi:hypothetical protein